MRTHLHDLFANVSSSFWLIPTVLMVVTAILSVVLLRIDTATPEWAEGTWWIYGGGAEGARALLAAIAGSMITVAGVVFSITVVTLSLASQQFGPRVLRTFVKDRLNQTMLGVFVATFAYCISVLRAVRGSDPGAFVPDVSVTAGIALAFIALVLMIVFVHHVAVSIQAPSIVKAVGSEVDQLITETFPLRSGDARRPAPHVSTARRWAVTAEDSGYVHLIDYRRLAAAAIHSRSVIVVNGKPGAFVMPDESLATVESDVPPPDDLVRKIRRTFALGGQRTATQDLAFVFRQLVEIAVRALSPGINDPFTALECLDRAGACLGNIARRDPPDRFERDQGGQIRVVKHEAASFSELADLTFGPILDFGRSNVEIVSKVLGVMAAIAPAIQRTEDAEVLIGYAGRAAVIGSELHDAWGRERIARESLATMDVLRRR